MWPAIKKPLNDGAEVREFVESLRWLTWRPSLIVLHNTAAPTLAQWHATADKDVAAALVPGTTRVNSLERYYQNDRHWSAGPHFFVSDDIVWVFSDPTRPGVHSPSWNHLAIGIEMIADFDLEDDDAGAGFKVRQNAEHLTALLCSTLGLDPWTAIKLHKEDPKTTHACPGIDFAQDRGQVVAEIAALMDGGEHGHDDVAVALGLKPAPAAPPESLAVTTEAGLNVRRGPGVTNPALVSLPKNSNLVVLDRAANGTTGWLKVRTAGQVVGWVAAKYVTFV